MAILTADTQDKVTDLVPTEATALTITTTQAMMDGSVTAEKLKATDLTGKETVAYMMTHTLVVLTMEAQNEVNVVIIEDVTVV